MSDDALKDALRREVRSRLPRPGTPEFVAASVAAQERLLGSSLLAGARTVGLYRALPSECGTAALAAGLAARGVAVCYPAVLAGERALQFRHGAGPFVAGALGVEEPTGAPVAQLDVLVVPALACDARGRRLGRGRGHYDATLAAFAGVAIALIFDVQLVPEVPVGEHDRPVAAVCTEARLLIV